MPLLFYVLLIFVIHLNAQKGLLDLQRLDSMIREHCDESFLEGIASLELDETEREEESEGDFLIDHENDNVICLD